MEYLTDKKAFRLLKKIFSRYENNNLEGKELFRYLILEKNYYTALQNYGKLIEIIEKLIEIDKLNINYYLSKAIYYKKMVKRSLV